MAGLVSGVFSIIFAVSFAALIFSGPLSSHVSSGISLFLFGSFVMGTTVALTSSFPSMIAGPQDIPAAILALAAAAIAATMAGWATPEESFATVVAAIAVTSVFTGVFFLALGRFRLGNLIRFIPYPVIGGFLAGTGWLLVLGAMGLMTDGKLGWGELPSLFQPDVLTRWLPGLVIAAALLVSLRRYDRFLLMPGMAAAAIGLFYLTAILSGVSISDLSAQGWLLGPFSEGGLWQPLSPAGLADVNWSVIYGQIGTLGIVPILSLVALLLNVSGLELTMRRDMDLNRELQSAGAGNLAVGLVSGSVGYQVLTGTTLAYRMGANSRLLGLIAAGLTGSMLVIGTAPLSYLPKPVVGGLILFLGLNFLAEWVFNAWFRLSRTDYFLVLLILAVVGTLGFLEGVGVGVVVAIVLFVVNYSRTGVIRNVLTGATFRSNVDRPVQHRRVLEEKGPQLLVLKLQGFVFFGTAHNLLDQFRRRATDPEQPPLRFAVLDFRLVTGLDSSAINSFSKMRQLAQAQNVTLIFTHLSGELRRQFEKGGFDEEHDESVRTFPDLDRGVEWCENEVLRAEIGAATEEEKPLPETLRELFPRSIDLSRLMNYLERQEVGRSEHLIRQGDPPQGILFIESGRVSALLEGEDGEVVRLRTMRAGTTVGEMGLYLDSPASASVVAEEPTVIYRLSPEALEEMEDSDPEIAAAFHKFMVRLLGERLASANSTLQALLD